MSDETLTPQKDEKGRFVTGNIGGGRSQGSRNKLGEQFVNDLYEHWKQNGKLALDGCLVESPAQYCRVVASLLPKEINHKHENPLANLTDEDFEIGLAAVRAAKERAERMASMGRGSKSAEVKTISH